MRASGRLSALFPYPAEREHRRDDRLVLSWEIDVKVSGYCDVLNPWNYAFVRPGNEDVLPATDAKWEKVSGSAFDLDPACGRWPSQMLEDIMTRGYFILDVRVPR